MVTSGPEKPTNHFQLHNENPLEDYLMGHHLIHLLFTVCELHQYPKTTFTVGRGDFCSLNSLSGFLKKKKIRDPKGVMFALLWIQLVPLKHENQHAVM